MSLINQVLNQLEQRGANTAPEQTQIRAVPALPNRDWVKPLLFAAGLLIVGSLGAWLWTQKAAHSERDVHGSIVSAPPVTVVEPVEADQSGPATRLSYELSVLPLPESLRPYETQPEPQKTSSLPLVANIAAEPRPVLKQEQPSSPPVITRREPPPPLKQVSPAQRADADYRKGVQAQQQGKIPEAMEAYEAALKGNEQHEAARLAMAAMLQENGSQAAAERTLQAGLRLKPVRLSYAMALARMQLGREQLDLAVATLQAHLAAADSNADYQSFYAALLQRQNRHKEALNHYQIALQISPRNGVWRVGYAISLQALERIEDAKLAYKQALSTHTLSPELTAFVQQKLAGL
ncbi:MAG: tetratricopeptide repeat protein [Gammaproteobacteria bacterium]|nr:tetratricopeptide repeat protein [Gammaproteobacteria bacterium]MBU1624781.1 tetratricopeptide repeat protein [Gammaproteobacteria bacterium]MBU1982625.1 tetratricopeptide repeat protein [Gammaproteobacteria bacterium]